MSLELFLSLIPPSLFLFTADDLIPILDAGDYWDNRVERTPTQKRDHIKRQLKKAKTHNGTGYPMFIHHRGSGANPGGYQRYMDAQGRRLGEVEGESEEDWPDTIDI
jgi:hypothetical protein